MIDLCGSADDRGSLRPLGRGSLVAELESHGLTFRRVERPGEGNVALLFAPLEGGGLATLSVHERSRLVLVAEGSTPVATEAEAAREASGLLGLVEQGAWRSWQRGLFVAWGLYGRPDIARAAGLTPVGVHGLQPAGAREALPATLARFLAAAEAVSHEP